jgi:hypothetical protein
VRRRISHRERRDVELRSRLGSLAAFIATIVVAVVIAHVLDIDQLPEHYWRTIGPGSDQYEQCFSELQANTGKFDIDRIEADRAGNAWVFRWRISILGADQSPTHRLSYTCVHRNGVPELRQPTYW